MTKIIISYRRSDTDVFAGRVRDRIAGRYGEDSVFIDVDNIPFGKDFRVHIHDAMSEADAVLVIIGPKWLGAGKGGRSRIMDETDPVRIEVETALSKHIPTIPILVGKTLMPKPEQLPDRLQNFAYVNAAPVDTGRDFHRDLNRVIAALNKILGLPLNTAERAAVVAETASAPAVASSGPIGEPKSAGDDGEPVAVAADPPRVERAMGIADIDGAGTTSRGRYKQLAAAICGVVIISGAAWWLWPGTASMAPAINIAPQPTAIPNTIDAQRKTTAVATASAVPSTATPPAVAALPALASAPQPTAIPTPVPTLKSANSVPSDFGGRCRPRVLFGVEPGKWRCGCGARRSRKTKGRT